MKKGYLILSIIVLVILLITNTSYALTATASFSADKTSAKKGEYVTCTFSVNSSDEIYGFEGYITYDKDFFTDPSISSSYSVNGGLGYRESGVIGIASTQPISSGTLFTFKVKVKEDTAKESGTIGFQSGKDLYVFDITHDECDLNVSPVTVTLASSAEETSGEEEKPAADKPAENNQQKQDEPAAQPANSEEKKDANAANPAATTQDAGKNAGTANKSTTGTENKTTTGTADKSIPKAGRDIILIIAIDLIAIIGFIAVLKLKKITK